METITLNGKEYVAMDSLTTGEKRIVIFQRGWVAVGDFVGDGLDCQLINASIIRNWGTTKGLGEIAQGGPTEKTILDPAGTIRFHKLTTIAMIDCEAEKWT